MGACIGQSLQPEPLYLAVHIVDRRADLLTTTGHGHPNSSAIRSIGPIIDLSPPSAAANDAFTFAAGP